MQKWRKVVLLITVLFVLIGGILGFLLGKSGGGGKDIVGKTNVFQWVMLVFLIMMFFCVVYDFYKIHIEKKRFGTARFSVLIKTRKLLNCVFIMQVILATFELASFVFTHRLITLLLGFIMYFCALMYGVHNSAKNGISENGIFHWGVYHGWNEVKSHSFENDTLLKMKISQKELGLKFNNEIKVIINIEEKEEIVRFVEERVTL